MMLIYIYIHVCYGKQDFGARRRRHGNTEDINVSVSVSSSGITFEYDASVTTSHGRM